MNIATLMGIAIISTVLSIMLKKYNPEYSAIINIVTGIFIIYIILSDFKVYIDKLNSIITLSKVSSEHIKILFKSLGICFLVQFVSDFCKDAGESAIASKIELAGKVVVLGMIIPLFEQVIKIVTSLLSK